MSMYKRGCLDETIEEYRHRGNNFGRLFKLIHIIQIITHLITVSIVPVKTRLRTHKIYYPYKHLRATTLVPSFKYGLMFS